MAGVQLNRGLALARCKSCGVEIAWAFTTGGKKAPYVRDAAGVWTLVNGTAIKYEAPSAQLELGASPVEPPQRWTSHFANCPNAAEHRRDRRGGE